MAEKVQGSSSPLRRPRLHSAVVVSSPPFSHSAIVAWADAGPEVAEPEISRLCREAEESIVAGKWLELASLMVTSAELVSSKISEKDLECTYTIICSLVKNANSPDDVLETVKSISSKVVQQPNDKPSLRLKILFNLYNLLDHPYARFQVYMKALTLASEGKVTE